MGQVTPAQFIQHGDYTILSITIVRINHSAVTQDRQEIFVTTLPVLPVPFWTRLQIMVILNKLSPGDIKMYVYVVEG